MAAWICRATDLALARSISPSSTISTVPSWVATFTVASVMSVVILASSGRTPPQAAVDHNLGTRRAGVDPHFVGGLLHEADAPPPVGAAGLAPVPGVADADDDGVGLLELHPQGDRALA